MKPSLSRVAVDVIVEGRGCAKGEIFRHIAPATVSALIKMMPLKGRVERFGDFFIYVMTGVVSGTEKKKFAFRKGDVSFMVSSGSICIFLKDGQVASPMNPLGRVTQGLEMIAFAGTGDVITIRPSEES